MCYRFAMSSFWSALAFANVELPAPLSWGVIKGLQLRNLRYWARQPGAYYPDGTLTIGYCYPNHNITENYNSSGSPYWCCKSFLCLALPETHPFWTAKEEPYPDSLRNTVTFLKNPLHIMVNMGGHTFLLSSGQQCSYPVKQSAAKYGKFAYSSAFGYSVPSGNGTLEELGGDSILALSDDGGETWKCRRVTKEARIEESRKSGALKWLRSMWFPWPDVEVETWLIPPQVESPHWHVRIHRIRTRRSLTSAEGAFAIDGQRLEDGRALEPVSEANSEDLGTFELGGEVRVASKAGVSGIVALQESNIRKGCALRMDANTNLVASRTVLPTLVGGHDASEGNIWIGAGVFGLPSLGDTRDAPRGWLKVWGRRPEIEDLKDYVQA